MNDLVTVCSTPMCSDGRAKVRQMWDTFNYLANNYQSFQPGSWQPTVSSIQAQLDAADSWYADFIPFNPACCTIADIGNQASGLINQMLASVGAATIPVPPASGTNWIGLAVVAGVVALAIVYAPQIKGALAR